VYLFQVQKTTCVVCEKLYDNDILNYVEREILPRVIKTSLTMGRLLG
jgi:hypothetical protein